MRFSLALIFSLISSIGAADEKAQPIVLTKDNTIVINTSFNWSTVAQVAQKAKDLDAILPTNEPLYLVMDTGGGGIDAGIELIENLNNLNRPVHTVSLFSASMGFQTVQGITTGKRYLIKNGTLMSHKAYGGFRGEFPGQLDSRYSHYLLRVQRLDKDVVERTKGKHTMQSYATLIENEYWCDGTDCIKQGFADAIAAPSCDKSLSGTNVESEKFVMFGAAIEVQLITSKCPMITGVLDFKVLVDGESLFKDEKAAKEYTYSSKLERLSKENLEAIEKKVQAIITNRNNNTKVVQKY